MFEILVRFTEVNCWEKALLSVIPIRKGATSKTVTDEDKDTESTGHSTDDESCDKQNMKQNDMSKGSSQRRDSNDDKACISETNKSDIENIKIENS